MKKTVLLLVVLLYLFGVILRVAGQLLNKEPINWKAALTLAEFDGTQDYGPRWKLRIVVMVALPVLWVSMISKQVGKIL